MSTPFKLVTPYQPTGDQPTAITQLTDGLRAGLRDQVLLGVTGSGKTFTMANVIQEMQRPTLVLAHNKTLAAQLFAEFREFFPENSVQYFVSYYDYYQPEAYVPRSDTYIAKEADINQEIEKFRHASTHALLTRSDVIIVASVSCIYGLGSPDIYKASSITLTQGERLSLPKLARQLTDLQFERNDIDLRRGRFQIQGDTITIFPAYDDFVIKLSFFGDELESIRLHHPISMEITAEAPQVELFPAKHYLTDEAARPEIIEEIRRDLALELEAMQNAGKILEAARLKERISYDLEMIEATGSVNGIENYSRYFDRRTPGSRASVLLDYFPDDYLMFIDESHMTIPQVGGMYAGDRSRKQTLIDYGFRLRAAFDNRPLMFDEFRSLMGQTIHVSATPSALELGWAKESGQQLRIEKGISHNPIAEQLIRPTGILDPIVEVRALETQVQDTIAEVKIRVSRGERALITTLTKRMAEELAEFLLGQGVKVRHLHSDVETLERSVILNDLRAGVYDAVVGINLLREGLDLPEVSMVAILDADKEGFLRSTTALVQTIGRAARHPNGVVYMYASKITGSMERAIEETSRRRAIQEEHNLKNDIVPQVMHKALRTTLPTEGQRDAAELRDSFASLSPARRTEQLELLKEQMRQAALNLEFEHAAELRDQLKQLQQQ
jgi:excinuclease ABC subunit B